MTLVMVNHAICEHVSKATVVAVCIMFSYLVTQVSYGQGGNETSTSTGAWTTYKNDLHGFSFDYPSSWNVEEKENRFDSAGDVSVSAGDIKFSATMAIDRPEDRPLKPSALLSSTRTMEEKIAGSGQNILIEPTDVEKYSVGGEKAGSFIVKHDDGTSPSTGIQNFLVFHNGDGYFLIFQAPTETFDSPETQNTLNKILQSFKFSNNG